MSKDNPKALAAYEEIWRPFILVRDALKKESIVISDIIDILKVSKRQILYWERRGMRFSTEKPKDRSWRKFSLFDLFGFAMIKSLRRFGIRLHQCESIYEWLRTYVHDLPHFIYQFAEGESVYFFGEIEKDFPYYFSGNEIDLFERLLTLTNEPSIIIPVCPILRDLLKKVSTKDFHASFEDDKFGNKNRVIFHVQVGYVSNINSIAADDWSKYEIQQIDNSSYQVFEIVRLMDSKVALERLFEKDVLPADRVKQLEKQRAQFTRKIKKGRV